MDAPLTVSLALDGWSAYHHGYIGAHLGNIIILLPVISHFCPKFISPIPGGDSS